VASRFAQRSGKLRTPLKGVRTLASFDLNEDAGQREAFGFCKAPQRLLLGIQTKAGAALLRRANPDVTDESLACHHRIPFSYKKHMHILILYNPPRMHSCASSSVFWESLTDPLRIGGLPLDF
jgi:hypothetical protein